MGGKGGPLAFLNKKGWHPGNQRNQEKVWKKEQEALAEQKQMEEIRKQYEEQRQREELDAVAVAAGVKLYAPQDASSIYSLAIKEYFGGMCHYDSSKV